MTPLRIAICGSGPDSIHPDDARSWVANLVRLLPEGTTLVCGRHPRGGPDLWAEGAAQQLRISTLPVFVDSGYWANIKDDYRKGNPSIWTRNSRIIQNVDALIVIWRGWESDMRDLTLQASKTSLPVLSIRSQHEYREALQTWNLFISRAQTRSAVEALEVISYPKT